MTAPESSRFREAREQVTGDSWIDDLARASLSAAEAKFGPPPEHETYVTPVLFRVSLMPAACLEGAHDLHGWDLYVRPVDASSGWLVERHGRVLSKDGEWDYRRARGAGISEWRAACEHRTHRDALDAARDYAPKVTVNDLTAVEVLARHRARNLECCRDLTEGSIP